LEQTLDLGLQPDRDRYTLACLLEDVASRHGDRTALRFQPDVDEPWQSLRYSELQSASRELAKGLIGAGVVKGARVAVLMANRPEWVVAAFAVGLVGGVLVPVNTFATPDERAYILRHSDASLLILQPGLLKRDFLAELRGRHPELERFEAGRLRCPALPQLRRLVVLGNETHDDGLQAWSELVALGHDVSDELLDATSAEVYPSDEGILIYTSGTTAHPKGVLHRQRAAVIQSWRFAEDMGLSRDDVVLTAQPFFWTAGIAMSLGASLCAGATLIIEETFSAERFLQRIESERVTALHAWPHQEKALGEHPDAGRRDLTSLEKIEFSSPLAPLAGIERDEWGTYGSYGLSETFTLSSSLPASAPAEQRKNTSGRPLPGMSIKIVDIESGEALSEPGAKGEIAVRGVTFMQGYYKVEPELYLADDGYFRTQDGGAFDAQGFLHWSGRLSNLIKTGGANVSPLEIEGALQGMDELSHAQAVGVPHPVLGEVIVLCAVKSAGAKIDEATLRERLRGGLAAYKVPRRVLFFAASELSFTANQKLQVGPLRDLAIERLQAEGAEIDGVVYRPSDGLG
jgi:acyl-CoA synthetase (AMP-forming)/AMP-acid ligase II